MFSNSFMTQADINYFNKVSQQSRNLLGTDRRQWNCEQIFRFLSLLRVQSKLQSFFYEFRITGELLFDIKYLWGQMCNYLESKTYFPIMKLMYIIKQINIKQRKYQAQNNIMFRVIKKTDQNQLIMKGKFTKNNKVSLDQYYQFLNNNNNNNNNNDDYYQIDQKLILIDIQQQTIKQLQTQFNQLGDCNLLQLSTNQLSKIFRSTQIDKCIEYSEIIKKYSMDGFCLLYLYANKKYLLEEINFHFSENQIEMIEEILNILLTFYYRRIVISNSQNQNNINTDINNNVFQNYHTTQNLKNSFKNSQPGTKSEYGTSQFDGSNSQLGVSQYEQQHQTQKSKSSQLTKSLRKSEYGKSEYGQSQQFGQSQYANSQYALSERGSLRGSLAESQFGDVNNNYNNNYYNDFNKYYRNNISIHFQSDKQNINKKPSKQYFKSSISDSSVIQRLKQVALDLPFNLFKMNPLQNIKITTLSYPFIIQFNRPRSHDDFINNIMRSIQQLKVSSPNLHLSKEFNITGVKFGRSQENDFRYPDQLSISGKHAQIGFWDNKYQLMDLHSKFGTFLYIPYTRPLILKDEQIIQLSNQIQIVVHILKKQPGEGILKLEFIKPENQPFYRASLKDNQILKIGSSQRSHIRLQQPSIQSKHTQIKYENQQFKIYDCFSSTGTWLRLSKKGVKSQLFPLTEGDIIRISSKRTYLVEKIINSLSQDDQLYEYEGILQNPNTQYFRQNNSQRFGEIIQNALR